MSFQIKSPTYPAARAIVDAKRCNPCAGYDDKPPIGQKVLEV
jgi:hypothetical protein